MPDLINPEFNDGKKKVIRWYDELCASCSVPDAKCMLIRVIKRWGLMTHSGAHIAHCSQYQPDKSSPYYIPDDAPMEQRARVNIEALEQAAKLTLDAFSGMGDANDVDK